MKSGSLQKLPRYIRYHLNSSINNSFILKGIINIRLGSEIDIELCLSNQCNAWVLQVRVILLKLPRITNRDPFSFPSCKQTRGKWTKKVYSIHVPRYIPFNLSTGTYLLFSGCGLEQLEENNPQSDLNYLSQVKLLNTAPQQFQGYPFFNLKK